MFRIRASTDLLPSLRARSAWRGGVGGGGWMPQETAASIDHRVPRARALRRDATEPRRSSGSICGSLRSSSITFDDRRRSVRTSRTSRAIKLRLVIELDGGQHAGQRVAMSVRTRYLEANGYRVLRFWNNDVLENIAGVLATIDAAVNADRPPTPDPSPRQATLRPRGEGEESTDARSSARTFLRRNSRADAGEGGGRSAPHGHRQARRRGAGL